MSPYYAILNKSGRVQIWRMPAEGGAAVQLTRNGGFGPQESFDGKFLYYLIRPEGGISDTSTLMWMPVEGGEETKVLDGISRGLWSLTRKGIFFTTRDGPADVINLYQPEVGKIKPAGRLPFRISAIASHLAVSEDGRWLLTGQVNRNDSDLMLIDNFR